MDVILDDEENSQLDVQDTSYVEGIVRNKTFNVMYVCTLLMRTQVSAP